jgi:hypothetical protein
MIELLIAQAGKYLLSGRTVEAKGLYYFAAVRYAQALGTLRTLYEMHQAGALDPTEDQETRILTIFDEVNGRLSAIRAKMGNGQSMGASRQSDLKAELREVIDTLITEAEGMF